MKKFLRGRRGLLASAAIGLICCGAIAAAEEVWVKRMTLPIREGKGAAYATVATAVKGERVGRLPMEIRTRHIPTNSLRVGAQQE